MYFSSCIRELPLEQNAERDIFDDVSPSEVNTPTLIDIRTIIVYVDVNKVPVPIGGVNEYSKALKLSRECVFGSFDLLTKILPAMLVLQLQQFPKIQKNLAPSFNSFCSVFWVLLDVE